jgi:hypothetical protein
MLQEPFEFVGVLDVVGSFCIVLSAVVKDPLGVGQELRHVVVLICFQFVFHRFQVWAKGEPLPSLLRADKPIGSLMTCAQEAHPSDSI